LKKIIGLVFFVVVSGKLFSQDTLPGFSIVERGNKILISWTNPYPNLVQLNIQRSYDSLKLYSTIFSATSPGLPENGYTDTKKTASRVYYRIFYVLQGGAYTFTKAKRAFADSEFVTGGIANDVRDIRDIKNSNLLNVVPGDKRVVTIVNKNIIYKKLSINAFRNFRDSILHLTRDTLFAVNDTLVSISPYNGPLNFKPSTYIYVTREGYINISLPEVAAKKYRIKFFEENGASLFEINNVKESPLIIDKSNFVHAGWFLFELYEDNSLKEKNRLYLPKDF
jgi:hypothetical protein